MSENKKNLIYLGKIRNQTGPHGSFQKIYIDNLESKKPDGTPDPYFKGALLWMSPDGNMVQVKQLGITVPKDGMNPTQAQNGFCANITLDLADETYSIKKL